MKKTNLINLAAFFLLLMALTAAVQSCKKDKDDPCDKVVCLTGGTCVDGTCIYPDPCDTVTCLNGGTCISGMCNCATGYEGIQCATETRAKFVASYGVTSGAITCGVSGNSSINAGTVVTIVNSNTSISKINISIGGSIIVVATVSGNVFTVDNQTVSGYTYTGTGSLNGTVLTLALSEYDSSVPETCVYSISATKN